MTIIKTLSLKPDEVQLLKKVVEVLEFWPGGDDSSPISMTIDEETTLWDIINKIKEL